ncbi:MAG: hypothetical protein KI791_08665 [Cyclobacteriaceae bacterium]|nr:hypothetical protein [Cyclobacteriaceae bacterium SS2]
MVRLAIIILFIIYFTTDCHAQINFKATLSPRHQKKVAQSKDVRTKVKRYKKFLEKDKKKQLKHYKDSLAQVAFDQIPLDSSMVISHLPDSSSRKDSLTWALNTLSRYKQFDQIEEYYEKISGLDSSMIPKLDSVDLEPKVNQIAQKYLPDDLDLPDSDLNEMQSAHMQGLSDVPIDLTKNPLKQTSVEDLPVEVPKINMEKSPEEQVGQLAQNVKGEQLAKLQTKMTRLKEKYVSIPDLSKPEEGIKRNSLNGRPLVDRLFVGGNVQIQSTDPVILDTDIQLGYKINKDLKVGVGFRWRESFAREDSIAGTVKNAHGYSGFINHDITKGFFVYAEYAAIMDQPIFSEVEVPGRWQYEYLLGVGRAFSVFKFLDMNILFLYDFNHKHNNLHPRPFEVRIGYQVTKLPKLPFGK